MEVLATNTTATIEASVTFNLVLNYTRAYIVMSTTVAVLGWGQGAHPPNLAKAPQIFRVIMVHKLLNTGQ